MSPIIRHIRNMIKFQIGRKVYGEWIKLLIIDVLTWLFMSASFIFTLRAFAHSLLSVWYSWSREEYSHGYLVPVIAALLAWGGLNGKLQQPKPSLSGFMWIVLGYFLLGLGELSTFNSASLYGFVIVIAGVVTSFWGQQASTTVLPALIFLGFAIPPPDFLYIDASTKLQLLSSSLAVAILDQLGFTVGQDGNVIDLGPYRLEVAEACSGLRYLFPLMSFSYLAAVLLRDRTWKRILLFVSAIPIAILLNVGRIVLVGMSVTYCGSRAAAGFLHALEGWVIFLACCGLLLLEVWLLRRIAPCPDSQFRLDMLTIPRWHPTKFSLQAPRRAVIPVCVTLTLLSVLNQVGLGTMRQFRRPAELSHVATLPLSIGDWHGRSVELTEAEIRQLALTDYWMTDFRKGDDDNSVNFYLAYYQSQSIGSGVHSPANCIPGGGWTILDYKLVTLPLGAGHRDIIANRLTIRRGGEDQLVYYWFEQRGRDLTAEWQVKWYLVRDQLLLGRSDGYLIRVTTAVTDGATERADARLQNLLTAISQYLPSEQR